MRGQAGTDPGRVATALRADDDLARGGSDRLVDALVVWGTDDAIRTRLSAFHDAGADHLALQIITGSSDGISPRVPWRRLAGILDLEPQQEQPRT